MPAPKSKTRNNFPLSSELIIQLVEAANLEASVLRGPSNNKKRAIWSRNEHVMEYLRIEAFTQLYDLLVDGIECPWGEDPAVNRVVGAMRLHGFAIRYDAIVGVLNSIRDSPGDFSQLLFQILMLSVVAITATMMRLHGVNIHSLTFPSSRKEIAHPAEELVKELEQLNPEDFRKSEYRNLQRALAGDLMQSGFGQSLRRELQTRELSLPDDEKFTFLAGHYRRAKFMRWISENRMAKHWPSLYRVLLYIYETLEKTEEEDLWLLFFESPPSPTADEVRLARLFVEGPESPPVEEELFLRRKGNEDEGTRVGRSIYVLATQKFFHNQKASQLDFSFLLSIISGNPAPVVLELSKMDPSEINPSSLLLVATAFKETGQFDNAVRILEGLVEDSDYGAIALRESAECYIETQEYEMARDTLLKIPEEQRLGADIEKLALIERALVTGKYEGRPESVPSAKIRERYKKLGKKAARYGYNYPADDYRILDSIKRKSSKQT